MIKEKMKFIDYPASVKYAVSMVYLSWFFFILSGVVYTGKISIFHLTMGMLVFLLAFSMKKSGRIFIIFYNSFMAVFIGVELYHQVPLNIFDPYAVVRIVSILFFSVSVIFLLLKSVSFYYREHGL